MKLFQCNGCGQVLLFENTVCVQCNSAVGFEPNALTLFTLAPVNGGYMQLNNPQSPTWVYCKNYQQGVCNWLVKSNSATGLCKACELNRYIPNIKDISNLEGWRALEFAKHRLVFSLLRMQLLVASKQNAPQTGMTFDFIDTHTKVPEDAESLTGHSDGLITITLQEADPVQREQTRVDMHERYRTLLGHLRHEIGHYYWDLLIAPNDHWLQRYRTQFGDERVDYGQALEQYYQQGAPSNWNQQFVTAYASSHPWEDWAETWSHYLHLADSMETAQALGISVRPSIESSGGGLSMVADIDPYAPIDFDIFLEKSLALTFAANSLNRSMGQPDFYPFILSAGVKEKLQFVHELLASVRGQ